MPRRTECEVLLHHTAEWFQHSPWSMESFSMDRLAPALFAAGLIEPKDVLVDGDEYKRRKAAWGMRVSRIFCQTQPFPLSWKWIWIGLVDEPYRSRIVHDLQAMAGFMAVPLPQIRPISGVVSAAANMAGVLQEFGEFVGAAGGPASDSLYNKHDDPAAVDEMLSRGADVIQAIYAELTALASGTGRPLPALKGVKL